MIKMLCELSPDQLHRTVDPQTLSIATTAQLSPIEGVIGQERATAALQLGLSIQDNGFNIYVAGPPGVGKTTAVRSFLEELAKAKARPPDYCYVNNFEDPYQPKVFQLPAGRGRQLQQDMQHVVELLREEIPKAFESDEYQSQRDAVLKTLNTQREETLTALNERANEAGFTLQVMPFGIVMIPMVDGQPLKDEAFQSLPAEAREELLRRRESLQEDLQVVMKNLRDLERSVQEQLHTLDEQVALYVVGGHMDDLKEKYHDLPDIVTFIETVQQDILDHITTFTASPQGSAETSVEGAAIPIPWAKELPFRKYQVNVLVDNGKGDGAPVVVELNPTYTNLFGRIEKETMFGALYTDFTMIKAGALHRANGGYLVLPVEDLLRNPFSWESLKRAIRSKEIVIEELGERLGFISTKSLRPQPIALQVKVVLVGASLIYYLLHAYDEQFPRLFKVKADFDTRMDWNMENVQKYMQLIATFCQKEQLKHLDAGAMARLLEHSARMAEDKGKLSTFVGNLTDVIHEANFWAAQEGAELVNADHVRKALDQQVYRASLIRQHIHEMIDKGVLLIDTSGHMVGQVNGLSVISLGEYSFGKPSRITASVGPGRGNIVDIEREVKLGGAIHSKGVFILSGYFTQKYAQDKPLTLSARLGFEQSYAEIDGDSASLAELYALLSALSGVPLKQGIGVTGSVNQHGETQAIGGVNEKIEGFFDVCQIQGLSGEQGVLIPRSNLPHLMLREDVITAVAERQFHIWAISTVDEGLEILTGRPAGVCQHDGRFTPDSVNDRVDWRLREFTTSLREASAPHDEY
jgi:lon-related putative ATP-dependent protease